MLATVSAGCGDTLYVKYAHHELKGEERIAAGRGCLVLTGHGGHGTGERDLEVECTGSSDSFVVEVRTRGEPIETREYSEKQLRSGKHDPFNVKTATGRIYELDFWGADDCNLGDAETD